MANLVLLRFCHLPYKDSIGTNSGMSFVINWENVQGDSSLNTQLKDTLNEKLADIQLPNYLANLQVVDFQLGETSPDLTIRDIDFPFKEFYQREETQLAQAVPVYLQNQNTAASISRPGSPHTAFAFRRTNTGSCSNIMTVGLSSMGYMQHPTLDVTENGHPLNTDLKNEAVIAGDSNIYEDADLLDQRANTQPLGLDDGIHSPTEMLRNMTINKNNGIYNKNATDQTINNESSKESDGMDIQLSTDLKWDSQVYIEIQCNLLLNYPSPKFITLPVRLKITDLKIHTMLIVAYIAKKVYLSFLCDIDDEDADDDDEDEEDEVDEEDGDDGGINTPVSEVADILDYRQGSKISSGIKTRLKSKERIDIIKDMKIEGELGNDDGEWRGDEAETNEALILRSIGKIEKFLVGAFRNMVINEMAWPNWIELDFNEDDDDEDDDTEDSEGERS